MKHKIIDFPTWKAQVDELLESEWYITDIVFDFEGLFEKEKNVKRAVNVITYDDDVAKQLNKRLVVLNFGR